MRCNNVVKIVLNVRIEMEFKVQVLGVRMQMKFVVQEFLIIRLKIEFVIQRFMVGGIGAKVELHLGPGWNTLGPPAKLH